MVFPKLKAGDAVRIVRVKTPYNDAPMNIPGVVTFVQDSYVQVYTGRTQRFDVNSEAMLTEKRMHCADREWDARKVTIERVS